MNGGLLLNNQPCETIMGTSTTTLTRLTMLPFHSRFNNSNSNMINNNTCIKTVIKHKPRVKLKLEEGEENKTWEQPRLRQVVMDNRFQTLLRLIKMLK